MFFRTAILVLAICSPVVATETTSGPIVDVLADAAKLPSIEIPAQKPLMSAELALDTYQKNAKRQSEILDEYEDSTTIEAELPKLSKKGRFELKRVFTAPKSLAFKAVDFVGDGFVKTNVIARLLQSEMDHVRKDDAKATAINSENYKFSYKGYDVVDVRTVHAFQVRPRKKRQGLFKGKIYLDAYTGSIVRAEGRLVKSPSVFIKRIDFVQDYTQVGEFNLISHIHSTAETRLVGPTVVNITHSDYRPKSVTPVATTSTGGMSPMPAAYNFR